MKVTLRVAVSNPVLNTWFPLVPDGSAAIVRMPLLFEPCEKLALVPLMLKVPSSSTICRVFEPRFGRFSEAGLSVRSVTVLVTVVPTRIFPKSKSPKLLSLAWTSTKRDLIEWFTVKLTVASVLSDGSLRS